MRIFLSVLLSSTSLLQTVALAQQVPTSPATNFTNSSSINPGTVIPKLLDSYLNLVNTNPDVLIQNYNTVISMTQNRTDAQTLKAVHDDRTAQPYSVMNGLGPLTSYFLTGAGASSTGVTPQSLTATTYATTQLSDYSKNINLLSSASFGSATFGNGTATPLAAAVNFINNTVRANSSTEPAKRTFERYQGSNPVINPLDPRYANYNATTNKAGLTTADTANILVPGYLSTFAVPTPYTSTQTWVQGFTVTSAMIAANGGNPITAPNVGTFDANGNFIPTLFSAGDYVPGIGAAPRPYRVSTQVSIPTVLYQVINSTDPYADGAYPSGHTNSAYLQALGMSFLVPQQGQELLARAADLGTDRILAGMHSPFDVMAGRIEASAISATNIYAALYDSQGNRLDWTNPANASAYAVYQAYTQTQSYLASACNAVSVTACIQASIAAGYGATDPYGNAAANKALYTADLTYGFKPVGASTPLTAAQVPVQAQVLLLTRFPYLTDAQRTDILASTGLPSGYPILSGNTYDGWGQLNLYAAWDGYGAFSSQVNVTMDASQGGYNAADSWNNTISGTGGLTKGGTGQLTLTGTDTYTGPTIINGGYLLVNGSIVSATTVNATGTLGGTGQVGAVSINAGGTLMPGAIATPGTLTVNGNLTMAANSTLRVNATAATLGNVKVNGVATLQGGTVQVAPNGTLLPFSQVDLVSATGGVTGKFASALSGVANLNALLSYSANDVTLTLNRNDINYGTFAATRNQARVASAVNAAAPNATSATAGPLVNGLFVATQTSPAATQAALDSLSGEGLTATQTISFRSSEAFTNSLGDQQAMWRDQLPSVFGGTSASPALGYVETAKPKADPFKAALAQDRLWHFWGDVYGGTTTTSASAAAGSAKQFANLFGGTIGVDYQYQSNWLVGAAAGATKSAFSVSDRATSGTVTGGHAALYSTYGLANAVYLQSSLTLSGFGNDVNRTAGGVGVLAGEGEHASFGSFEIRAHGEIGKRFDVNGFGITPFSAIEFANLSSSSFTETSSAGALSLATAGHSSQSVPIFEGARFDGHWSLENDMALTSHVTLAYMHDFSTSRSLSNAFVSLPGSQFTVDGTRAPSNAFQTKVGLDLKLKDNVSLFANFQGSFSSSETAFAGKGGVKIAF